MSFLRVMECHPPNRVLMPGLRYAICREKYRVQVMREEVPEAIIEAS